MVEEHLRKLVAANQRDWDARLSIFHLSYRASTHDTIGLTSASLVFGRELCLPCNLLFGATPDKEWLTIDHTPDLVDHLYNIYKFCLPTSEAGQWANKNLIQPPGQLCRLQGGQQVWLYHPVCKTGKSLKLQFLWKGQYRVVIRINEMVYRIQQNPRTKLMVVHMDWFTPYQGTTREERP